MSLMCGGKGPCCHVGYAHRHCEHCDVVIPLVVQPHSHSWPWGTWQSAPVYSQLQGLSGLYNQQALPRDTIIRAGDQ